MWKTVKIFFRFLSTDSASRNLGYINVVCVTNSVLVELFVRRASANVPQIAFKTESGVSFVHIAELAKSMSTENVMKLLVSMRTVPLTNNAWVAQFASTKPADALVDHVMAMAMNVAIASGMKLKLKGSVLLALMSMKNAKCQSNAHLGLNALRDSANVQLVPNLIPMGVSPTVKRTAKINKYLLRFVMMNAATTE